MEHRGLNLGWWPGLSVVMVTAASCGSSDHLLGSQSTLAEGGLDVLQGDDRGTVSPQSDAASGGEGSGGDGALSGDSNVAPAEAGTPCGTCPQGQHCDPTLGCVTCATDSQCPASMRFCVLGNCVQCKSNTDCGGGTTPSCWPGSYMCHAGCTTNQQCAQQDNNVPICNTSTGACVGCMTSANCPSSQGICDPTTLQCVQCTGRADCAGTSTPACVQNRCVPCATSADCSGATPYCSPGGDSPWRCVQCLLNTQCPPSAPSCNSGTCGRPGG
jgi:hypothetical protein